MKPRLKIEVVHEPHPDAENEIFDALDSLATGLADLFIARARAEVARERGVTEETIDLEHKRVVETVQAFSPFEASDSRQTLKGLCDRKPVHQREGHVSACHLQPATSQRGNTR